MGYASPLRDRWVRAKIVQPAETDEKGFLAVYRRGFRRYSYSKILWLTETSLSPTLDNYEVTVIVGEKLISVNLEKRKELATKTSE